MVAVVVAHTPETEASVEEHVMIHAGIVAVGKVDAVVGSAIGVVAHGRTEVEVVAVGIALPDAHTPRVAHHVEGTVEVVAADKLAVLAVAEHIHEVFVAHVEQVVVVVHRIVVSVYHIVNHLVHMIEEVEVYLIHILILTVREAQLVPHAVAQEACFVTYLAQAHRCEALCTDSCQGYHHHGNSHLFHTFVVLVR